MYMPQIQIPSPLRQYSGKQASVDVQGKTVGEALSGLVSQHPDLKRHLYTDDGKLRSFVNVYVNDEDMRYLQKEATSIEGRGHDFHSALDRRRLAELGRPLRKPKWAAI